MDSALHALLEENHAEVLPALGLTASQASLNTSNLAQVASALSLANQTLSRELTALQRPSISQKVLTGAPSDVSEQNSGIDYARMRSVTIANGTATLALGWGLRHNANSATLTLLNGFLIPPGAIVSLPNINNFVNTGSAVSLAALWALVASNMSGARASFMWNVLPINLI